MTADGGSHIIKIPSDVTCEWLAKTLKVDCVTSFTSKRIGTGQVSENYLLNLHYSPEVKGPNTVVLKLAAQDPTSRHSGAALRLYQREVDFYAQISHLFPDEIAQCYHSSFDDASKTCCILLQDASPAVVGDDIQAATVEQARLAMSTLGKIHGKLLRQTTDATFPWLQQGTQLPQALLQQFFNGWVSRYRHMLSAEHIEVCSRLVQSFDGFQKKSRTECLQGMIHGDYRMDNLLFGTAAAKRPLTVVDWQTVTWGSVLGDVAYFMGCALKIVDRRAHYDELVNLYYESLGEGTLLTLERCHAEIQQQTFFGVIMGIASPMLVAQTERGDTMFITMMQRHCQFALDLKSLDILPPPTEMAALRPEPEDERGHPKGPEEDWNESYYFDVVDSEQGIGAYVRIGITPNQKSSWYTAIISRKGQPLVAVMDYKAQHPGEDLCIKSSAYNATHEIIDPLKNFRITFEGEAESFESDSAPLRGEKGTHMDAALDLNFLTDGAPYRYRVATRYEVPCLVDGTIKVDGKTYNIKQQVGQRDHSWGVRNWWNMNWMWGNLHFSDGTHIHLLDMHIHGQPQMSIGYVQNVHDKSVTEIDQVDSLWTFDANGLCTGTTVQYMPHDGTTVQVDVEPIGHGPLRLVSEGGQIAFFERAWCKGTTKDGKVAYAWFEWNRVQES